MPMNEDMLSLLRISVIGCTRSLPLEIDTMMVERANREGKSSYRMMDLSSCILSMDYTLTMDLRVWRFVSCATGHLFHQFGSSHPSITGMICVVLRARSWTMINLTSPDNRFNPTRSDQRFFVDACDRAPELKERAVPIML
jgi:hypothetical protein